MDVLTKVIFSLVRLMPQYGRVQNLLRAVDVQKTLSTLQNHAPKGVENLEERETEHYSVRHVIEDGIESITYTPKNPRYQTPILMLHGMWHGAWCWQQWQELFAEWGWTSTAISLPGHGKSPTQKSTYEITLDYYLAFLRDAVDQLGQKPVLMGHSMGGAITQWYLRHVSDDLPAVVLVGSWVHDDAGREGFGLFLRLDPIGMLMVGAKGDATPFIRTPAHAAKLLISNQCIYTPEQLHAKLSPESALVMNQHNPPFWTPAPSIRAPLLYVAGERDAVLSVESGRITAEHYGGDFMVIPDAAHNLMMDAHYQEVAAKINDWLNGKKIS